MSTWQERLYKMLGQYDGFYTRPPLDERKMYIGSYVVKFNNDGGETWIGFPSEWLFHCNNDEFRKICFWYLRQWIFIDWFGLRSFLWYKLLTIKCNRSRS